MNLNHFKKRFNKGTFFALSSLFLATTVFAGANLFAAFAIAFVLSTLCILAFHLIKEPNLKLIDFFDAKDPEAVILSNFDKKKPAITPKRELDDLERNKAELKRAWGKVIARREADLAKSLKPRR